MILEVDNLEKHLHLTIYVNHLRKRAWTICSTIFLNCDLWNMTIWGITLQFTCINIFKHSMHLLWLFSLFHLFIYPSSLLFTKLPPPPFFCSDHEHVSFYLFIFDVRLCKILGTIFYFGIRQVYTALKLKP